MQHPEGLSQWVEDIAKGLPVLSVAQGRVLAQWCFAMEQTGQCGCHAHRGRVFSGSVSWAAPGQRCGSACVSGTSTRTTSRDSNRREVDVRRVLCARWPRWVLAHWSGHAGGPGAGCHQPGRSLDHPGQSASSTRAVPCPSPGRSCPANQKHAWNPEWLALLDAGASPAFPADWQVIVLTDRGLYSRTHLSRHSSRHGWHPFMRVNSQWHLPAQRESHPHDRPRPRRTGLVAHGPVHL